MYPLNVSIKLVQGQIDYIVKEELKSSYVRESNKEKRHVNEHLCNAIKTTLKYYMTAKEYVDFFHEQYL